MLRAPVTVDIGLTAYSARDEFNQTAGPLTGKAAVNGGNWAWIGAGDADDFNVSGAGVVTRTAVSDALGLWNGRLVTLGSNALVAAVKVDIDPTDAAMRGPMLRASDTNNFMAAVLTNAGGLDNGLYGLTVYKRVGGSLSQLTPLVVLSTPTATAWTTVQFVVFQDNTVCVWVYPRGSKPGDPVFLLQDNALPPTGKPGLVDFMAAGTAATRTYDNFASWVPVTDAVLNPSQSAELRTEGMFREDAGGNSYGPVSWAEGSLPRLPPTVEGRTTEVLVKASRGDFDQIADAGIDDVSARITYRPSWLTVPGT